MTDGTEARRLRRERAPSDSVITWTNYHTHYRVFFSPATRVQWRSRNERKRERERERERERGVCHPKIADRPAPATIYDGSGNFVSVEARREGKRRTSWSRSAWFTCKLDMSIVESRSWALLVWRRRHVDCVSYNGPRNWTCRFYLFVLYIYLLIYPCVPF